MTDKNTETPMTRKQILFPSDDLKKIDDWRIKSRVWSMNEAVRRLVMAGLEAEARGQ